MKNNKTFERKNEIEIIRAAKENELKRKSCEALIAGEGGESLRESDRSQSSQKKRNKSNENKIPNDRRDKKVSAVYNTQTHLSIPYEHISSLNKR